MKGLSQPLERKRFLLIVAAVLLLMVLWVRVLPYLAGGGTDTGSGEADREAIARYRSQLKEKASLEARQRLLTEMLARQESRLLQSKTAALAVVDIQNIVREIAAANGVEIKTMRNLKPSETGGGTYLSVPIEITLSSDIRQLVGLIYRIETAPKLLRITRLVAQTGVVRGVGTSLVTNLTLEGFMKTEH